MFAAGAIFIKKTGGWNNGHRSQKLADSGKKYQRNPVMPLAGWFFKEELLIPWN